MASANDFGSVGKLYTDKTISRVFDTQLAETLVRQRSLIDFL